MENVFSPSDFVAVLNQTLEYAYPSVVIEGEVSNLRISKGKWVYFDIKDDFASVKCFGTTYQLRMPIEDGMMVRLKARPQLHPLYNFSLTVMEVVPRGEGSIKRGFELLQKKLEAEGLFDLLRKRTLPYPPLHIGLVTSSEAAAYGDFVKIIKARWPLLKITLAESQVQGADASSQLKSAVERLAATDVEVIILIRGGGSADDLVAFNDEQLVRAVANCRIPTMAAIGHERDITLVELVADVRASTPSNAAELLVPDINIERRQLIDQRQAILAEMLRHIDNEKTLLRDQKHELFDTFMAQIENERGDLRQNAAVIEVLNPGSILRRGYVLVRSNNVLLRSVGEINKGQKLEINFYDGLADVTVEEVTKKK